MDLLQTVIGMAETTLKMFQNSELDISVVLQNCLIIATYLDREDDIKWIKSELGGYERDVPSYRILKYQIVNRTQGINPYWNIRINRRDVVGVTEGPFFENIEEVKKFAQETESIERTLHIEGEKYPIAWEPVEFRQLLNQLKIRIITFLTDILRKLKYEDVIQDIFFRRRQRTIEIMNQLSPEAIGKLNKSYENLRKGGNEDLSALTLNCRRLFKDLADKIFPPRKQPYKGREVTDDKEFNRILAFLSDKMERGSQKKLVTASIEYYAHFIDALRENLDKGVHADVIYKQAEQLLIYSFLILSDILEFIE